MKGVITRLESEIDDFNAYLTVLEDKLVDPPDLHQTPDPSFLSLIDTFQYLSSRFSHCDRN